MAEARIWRCRICGDSYLGHECPSNCPFCGAHTGFIVPAQDYPPDINTVEITESERADLEYACDVEITNATFYKALGEIGDRNCQLPSAYRALRKVEMEHLAIFGKLLKTPVPTEPTEPLPVHDDWAANIAQSHQREEAATAFYVEAATRATTPRVKEVFTAIAEVEADHVVIDKQLQAVTD